MKQVSSRSELLAVAHDVLVTLLGAESFANFEGTAKGLSRVATAGCASNVPLTISYDDSRFRACLRGKSRTEHEMPHVHAFPVCVPLEYEGRVVGVLAIYELLPQKAGLSRSDCELLNFLTISVGAGLVAFTPSRGIEVAS